ncbi:hypothetical protein [Brevundimonas sp.]|uniref:hypothetical protein n=1 Tax=Brevundimonas sp. TaxID=1871086 RepID=UPI002D245053|nr:hypothetical protein [Brevundimonas sp.]HYC98615.1 hypothetical protein [Brevundimonas sp.]
MGLTDLCTDIVARGEVTANDVLALRREVFGEITVTPEEVEALFRVDEGTERRVPEWRAFFLEAMTDWLVRQQEPSGYITQEQADWLVARIEADRRVRNGTELELVVRALELADEAPASLSAFGLSLVTRAVVENDGIISADEVERMRRLVFALAGPGRMAVTREEAGALFDLNDATRGRDNDPGWTDFFKRAVANAVTAAAGWAPPERAEALRRQAWLEAPEGDPVGLVGETLAETGRLTPARIRDALFGSDHAYQAEHVARHEREIASAAPVDREEACWLLDRIGRDGEFDVNERALIGFLREIAPGVDPALQPLVDRAAA